MNGEDGFWKNILSGANHGFKETFVSVLTCPTRDLNDKRGLTLDVAAKQAGGLLQVINVVGANGILPIGNFEKLVSSYNHGWYGYRT